MGFNSGEIVLIIIIVVLVFGIGRLGRIGEAIGKMREGLAQGEAAAPAEPPRPGNAAPTTDDIRGPVEDAEVVDRSDHE